MLLCRSRLPESSFLPCGIEIGQLLQYSHAYQLSVCVNIKRWMRARAYFPISQNDVKTETFSPQNDRTMELNVNILLTATVCHIRKILQKHYLLRATYILRILTFTCISTPEYLSIKLPHIHGNYQVCLNQPCKKIANCCSLNSFWTAHLSFL